MNFESENSFLAHPVVYNIGNQHFDMNVYIVIEYKVHLTNRSLDDVVNRRIYELHIIVIVP